MKTAILYRFKCTNEFKIIRLFTAANQKFQYFEWLQMEILFASGFDRNKELMEKLILLVKEQ